MYKRIILAALSSLILGVFTGCSNLVTQYPTPLPLTRNINVEPTGTITTTKPQTEISTSTVSPVLVSSHISGWAVYSFWVSQNPAISQIFLKNLETGEVVQLTHSGNNSDPIWSPDGSQIMYLSWTKENSFDIYLMDKDGKDQRPIVASPAEEIMPDWSPDGSKIAYVSNQDGNDEIYTIDLKTNIVNKLAINISPNTGYEKWSPGSPKWSPDGKQIAFISTTGISNTSQVFVMNVDGTNVRALTDYDLHYDDSPVWCPDSSCIIFERDLPKLMLFDFEHKAFTPLFDDIFPADQGELGLARTFMRGYITFSVDGMFYAMDLKSREIYLLGVKAMDLSLYP